MSMLFVLMLLGAVDVIGRYFFNKPIMGGQEMSLILLAGLLFFGWVDIQYTEGHIRVDLFLRKFSYRRHIIADIISWIIGFVLFSLICWQSAQIAITYWRANRLIDVINMPLGPFYLFISIGAFFVCIVFIAQILRLFSKIRKDI